ncbi:large subunit ribosomal protein L30e [Babesia microti strain RI]|uniref:Large subunit ribosomal protein L30e n=1 Tax=Babesia microti (strain RI) TaxID=1133968 RepID=A0A1R4ABZ0_BABMR|nr:large subunit ribosomal protein L30e [Babesia microti strain RI]SJK86527.1 large subunit ribosomal protein L30e [Babesia microti strain RI]|eukprot:XP_021338676.1 large subunit ribosomal protein L30e [Babesia microti strain RI]
MKKTKNTTVECMNSKIQLVMKSGKVCVGFKSSKNALSNGKAKLVILSNNFPSLRRSEIEYYAMLAKCGVHHYSGNNNDLGAACGKMFRIGCMAVIDPGDSDIIKSFE